MSLWPPNIFILVNPEELVGFGDESGEGVSLAVSEVGQVQPGIEGGREEPFWFSKCFQEAVRWVRCFSYPWPLCWLSGSVSLTPVF